jgi:hypothetical protein
MVFSSKHKTVKKSHIFVSLPFMNLNEREIISFLAMTMYEKTFPNKRFKHTLEFLNKHISPTQTILDLGVENPFQES